MYGMGICVYGGGGGGGGCRAERERENITLGQLSKYVVSVCACENGGGYRLQHYYRFDPFL